MDVVPAVVPVVVVPVVVPGVVPKIQVHHYVLLLLDRFICSVNSFITFSSAYCDTWSTCYN